MAGDTFQNDIGMLDQRRTLIMSDPGDVALEMRGLFRRELRCRHTPLFDKIVEIDARSLMLPLSNHNGSESPEQFRCGLTAIRQQPSCFIQWLDRPAQHRTPGRTGRAGKRGDPQDISAARSTYSSRSTGS